MSGNWQMLRLIDLVGPNGLVSDGDWIESKDQDPDGDVRLVQLADIGEGEFIDKSRRFLTSKRAEELKCTHLKKGDLLIARMPDPLGRACIFPGDIRPSVTAVDVCIVRPDNTIVDTRWLMHSINSAEIRREIEKGATGTTRTRIATGKLKSLSFQVPPLEEQRRIAAILDKADSLRRKRQQALQLADDFLRATFLDLFGDPVTSPKGWPIMKFDDLGKWSSGGTPSRQNESYFQGDINWFSAGELNSMFVSDSIEKISVLALKESAAKLWPSGSILLGMYDTAAFKSSIILKPSAANQACACLIANESLLVEWFYFYIQISKDIYLKLRRGVRQKNLNLGMIRDFELPLPPLKEQEKFIAVFNRMQGVIAKFEDAQLISSRAEAALSPVAL